MHARWPSNRPICPIADTSDNLAQHLRCHRTASMRPCRIRTAPSAFFILPLTLVVYATAVAHVDTFHRPGFNPSPLASARRRTHANIDLLFPSLCIPLKHAAATIPLRVLAGPPGSRPFPLSLSHLGQTPNLHVDPVSTLQYVIISTNFHCTQSSHSTHKFIQQILTLAPNL